MKVRQEEGNVCLSRWFNPTGIFLSLCTFCVLLCITCNFYKAFEDCEARESGNVMDVSKVYVLLDIDRISLKIDALMIKRIESGRISEEESERITRFLYNLEIRKTRAQLKIYGGEADDVTANDHDLTLEELRQQVASQSKVVGTRLAVKDRQMLEIIEDEFKIVKADGIIELLHLQPQDIGCDWMIFRELKWRSHRILLDFNLND